MKKNKTYTSFRLALFIGLFSFHALSCCINTQRGIGTRQQEGRSNLAYAAGPNTKEDHEFLKVIEKYPLYPSPPLPWYKTLLRPRVLVPVFVSLSALTGLTVWYCLNTSSEDNPVLLKVITGTTMSDTGTALQTNGTLPLQRLEPALIDYVNTTVGPIVNSTVSSVVNATKIAGTLATTLLPTAGLVTALRSNSSNVGYNTHHQNATQRFMPSDSHTPSIEKNGSMEPYNAKPNTLEKEFIDYILANNLKNFSVPTMQYWIRKDPSIVNARNPNSQTLLMFAAEKDKFDVVECLVENGADVNLPDRDQNTGIRHVDGRNPNAKRIYDYLLEHGADPCIKNLKNRRLDDTAYIYKYIN